MDGKRNPVDFESLKSDLRDLGLSLRVGFEEAKQGFNQKIKHTHRLRKSQDQALAPAPIPIRVKNIKGGSTRRYSLQQGLLAVLGGGASAAAFYAVLQTAAASGLLGGIEQVISTKLDVPTLTGFVPVVKTLWVLPLVSCARGVAHLVNGIFFPVKPDPAMREIIVHTPQKVSFKVERPSPEPVEVPTNELEPSQYPEPQLSVTEDETIRLGTPKQSV